SKEANEGWILNGPEFHCDKGCRQELYMKRLANPDKSNCLDDDILSPNRTQRMKLQLCLRLRDAASGGVLGTALRIGGANFISFEDRHWHNDCFICAQCTTSRVGK
ncbi:hypothetical protein GCK32_020752, partial [Trichostrongylus colubriformis]